VVSLRKILVGIDLARSRPPGGAALDLVTENAFRRALWAAQASGATLTLLTVLPRHQGPLWYVSPAGVIDPPLRPDAVDEAARHTLTELVRDAWDQGVKAGGTLAGGTGWVEIIRQVTQEKFDLLVVGTHDPHGLRRLLLGSTAQKLLHDCPCPVWVSKLTGEVAPRRVLIASDLSVLSDDAVRHGLKLAHLAGAQAHVLNVVDYALDRHWSATLADDSTTKYHTEVRTEVRQALQSQVQRCGGGGAEATVQVHVVDGDGLADHAILQFARDHQIDLLVMGTMARHGLSGALLGNTVERLLPELPCSVLAVKPADFRPVRK
jgi:universal stress protein E